MLWRKARERGSALLYGAFEDIFPEKVTMNKDLQEMGKGAMKISGGRVFQAERKAGGKGLEVGMCLCA